MIWSSVGARTIVDTHKPSVETICDRFKSVIEQRRKLMKATSLASGIVEEREGSEFLAHDIILEMDE